MSSLWYRVTDAIDCKITDAAHQGDGRRWAKTVKLGHTYYTIKTARYPFGDVRYLDEHVFTRLGLISALPEGAEGVYNANGGKVYSDRNHRDCKGLPTLREYSASGSAEELVTGGNLNDYSSQPKRGRRAA